LARSIDIVMIPHHIRQAMANVQAIAWPHMGNAQRF
jgi:hypothetical protein